MSTSAAINSAILLKDKTERGLINEKSNKIVANLLEECWVSHDCISDDFAEKDSSLRRL